MIQPLPTPPTATDRAALSALLRDAVERSASVGFLLPLTDAALSADWSGVLASGATGHALNLSDRCGYTRAGTIPRHATDPDSPLIDTVVRYKELAVSPKS